MDDRKNTNAGNENFRALIRKQIAAHKISIRKGVDYKPYLWGQRNVSDQL